MLEVPTLPSITFAQASKALRISEAAVRSLIDSGDLRTVVPPLKKRPRVLTSSLAGAYEKIYGVETQPTA
jgi:hypothetical protein